MFSRYTRFKRLKKGNTNELILTKIDKGKRNDCLQFLRIRGSKKRYKQGKNMFKRFPNTWPNIRF